MKKIYITLVLSLLVCIGYAQQKISGKVVEDATQQPVIGAMVSIQGTQKAVITDAEGKFSVDAKAGQVLEATYMGYKPKFVTVSANQTNVTITMETDAKVLDEIVVVGYGTEKKVNLTGSIASVDAKTIENIASANLSNTLAGRAPGVTIVNNSGFAGATSSIRMRGATGEPLFVINNIIRDKTAFDMLDPNEVANFSFLKDAASASIYGSKAGNGVVLVTTKKGSEQKPMFQYKGSYTISGTTKDIPDFTAKEELMYKNQEARTKNIFNPNPKYKDPYGPTEMDYFNDKSYAVNDYIWQNPWNTQHNVSVNGGNDRITYYMMAGFLKDQGSYKNVDYNRYNFRSDVTANITDSFKVNFNISGTQRNYDRFYWPYDDWQSQTMGDFYRSTFNWTRLYPFYAKDMSGENAPYGEVTDFPISSGGWNPVEMVNVDDRYTSSKERSLDAILRLDLDLGKVVKGLTTAFTGQYNAYDRNRKDFVTFNRAYVFQPGDPDNQFIPGPLNPNAINIHNLSNSYEGVKEYAWFNNSYQLNWYLNYNRQFGKHGVSGMLVWEQSEGKSKYFNGGIEDMLAPIDQIFAGNSSRERTYFGGNEGESSRVSWIGRFNYNYDDRYIAEFSFREDGNTKFMTGKRWGFFPSASLAWRISNEKFFDIDWFNNLKLRGSYGTTGDDGDIAAFGWRNKYGNSGSYLFGEKTLYKGIAIGSTPNPTATWATLESWDIGVDFGFLNNRLTGEAGYFKRVKKDILQSRVASLPDTYGRGKSPENYAEQQWTGFEVAMRWRDNVKDFNYEVYANMGYVQDKWNKYDEAVNLPAWKSRIGLPNSSITGKVANGIYRTQAEIDVLPETFTQFGVKPIVGMMRYVDIRSDNEVWGPNGKVDGNDWDYLSRRAVPRINYGFGANLEWKGIALDLHFQGVGAYDRMISTRNGGGVFQVDRPYFGNVWGRDYWTEENPNAKYPRIANGWTDPNYGGDGSTFWLKNGAYLRLKNLNLAYTLPQKWFTKLGVSHVQVYANGTNLFSIDGMDGLYDPEQETLDSYPVMRSFTVGLNINF